MLLRNKKSALYCVFLFTFSFLMGCKKSGDVSNGTSPTPPANTAPIVSTSNSFSASLYAVTCGGSVLSNGGASVTEKGICYNVSPTPTILNSKIISTDTSNNFVLTVTSLSPNTTYYIRAYATNSLGTSYGSQITISTSNITSNSDAGNTMYVIGISSDIIGSVWR